MLSTFFVLAVCYISVLVSIIADLLSGAHRARLEHKPLTSSGFRRTVSKITSYYSALFALTAIDAMLIAASVGLRAAGSEGFPLFPYVSTLGAIGLSLIEVKSIFENTSITLDLEAILRFLGRILSSWKGL
ncbi:MAG: phage holin family protein [Muribaculaceae bacterium]|nr:phage holin family protein [Muribaculaceae bacterium]